MKIIVSCSHIDQNLIYMCSLVLGSGMNAAVRAVTRMGIYVGAKVYLIYEVNKLLHPVYIEHISYMVRCSTLFE